MKTEILEKPRVIMSNPLSLHNYFAWPTVARLKDGRLALAASGFRLKHICPFGKVALSFSDDEGKTWSVPAIAVDTVLDDRDAGLCPFGDDGLIVTSFNNTTDQQRRWAEGEHAPDDKLKRQSGKDGYYAYKLAYLDSVPAEAETEALGSSYSVSFNGGRTFGQKFIAPVTSPHGPVELKNGKILWVGRTFGGENDRVEAHEITPDGKTTFLGAIENIHRHILREREKGTAILLISLELDEIMTLADTIGVLYRGEMLKTDSAENMTVQEVGRYMMGVKEA